MEALLLGEPASVGDGDAPGGTSVALSEPINDDALVH